MNLFEDLKWRGLVKDISNPDIEKLLNGEPISFYWGTDPTADSLHLGHYSSLVTAKRLAKAGHHPILLIGGATGLIGDPRPTAEREIISKETLNKNLEGISKQVSALFDGKAELVNNYDWFKGYEFLDFLRDVGKYINVNYMLDKDIIKRRLDEGITYCEFSYMLMQAMDFVHLYQNKGVTLQVAGSDQWGNITTGIELARKKLDVKLYGFTMPLILDSNGVKFGKTEGNALWLDETKTSSYELYQYLINTDDKMVIDYLKKLTFLTKEEIENIEQDHFKSPEKRLAQEKLAEEVITFLHGKTSFDKAKHISKVLFSGNVNELSDEEIEDAFKQFDKLKLENLPLIDLLVSNSIASSKREAREFIKNNAITLNGEVINDENYIIDNNRKYNIIRRGKKKYYIFEK